MLKRHHILSCTGVLDLISFTIFLIFLQPRDIDNFSHVEIKKLATEQEAGEAEDLSFLLNINEENLANNIMNHVYSQKCML